MPRSHRSAFTKFRCGVASLRIETGRFENLRIEERICCVCSDFIEDEAHVLLNCPFYDDVRENLFNVAKSYTVDFMSFNNEEKIMFLFSNENMIRIRVITKLPNSEQSYKGKVKTHNYINRQNQSTTGKL